MNALAMLVEKWILQNGCNKKKLYSLEISHCACPVQKKFGFDAAGEFQKYAFDSFYDKTRTLFFLDEEKSTFQDALYELQPNMFEFFIHEMDAWFLRAQIGRPIMFELDEYWFHAWLQRFNTLTTGDQQVYKSFSAIERERQRKSQRSCVLQRREIFIQEPKKRKLLENCELAPQVSDSSSIKPKKLNYNCVQWKHLQVQARKQLHDSVLSYRFSHVRHIAKEWERESEQERRLDINAIEWAFRRICKQLLPLAAEKEIAMRENSLKMIDTLFESFSLMGLCKNNCMRKHIIDICRSLDHRKDIIDHMMQYKCSCF